MASQASDFTSASLELISKHAQARTLESDAELQHLVIYNSAEAKVPSSGKLRIEDAPLRFLNRQHHATKNVRDQRLFTWVYIRRHEFKDIQAALQKVIAKETSKGRGKGKTKDKRGSHNTELPPSLIQELQQSLLVSPVYHLVTRGQDALFSPPNDKAIKDVVTGYFLNPIHELREDILKYLDMVIYGEEETGSFPSDAFRELMADAGFVAKLKMYFDSGDRVRESSLHLVGRLRGGNCFLFRCIKENQVDLLRLLLAHHVPEVTRDVPWMRLAEPCLPCGQYKNTSFHEAAYYGRADCLELLLDYARRHSIDIRHLKNEEDRNKKTGLTVLEMSKQNRNWRCFNLLAPLFLEDTVEEGIDHNTREVLRQSMSAPRMECIFTFLEDGSHASFAKITAVCHFKTLLEEQNHSIPTAPVAWAHFFETSTAFLMQLCAGFRSAEGQGLSTDGNSHPVMAQVRVKRDEPVEMTAFESGRLMRDHVPPASLGLEPEACCSLAVELRHLRFCGPGTARIYDSAQAWLKHLANLFLDARSPRLSLKSVAFLTCFASSGPLACEEWLRAMYDHTMAQPSLPLPLKFCFRTLPAIAEYDEETIRFSKTGARHGNQAAQLAKGFLEEILLKQDVFLDLSYNSSLVGCFTAEQVGTADFPQAIISALEFALAPVSFVHFMFKDELIKGRCATSDPVTQDAAGRFQQSLTLCGAAEVPYTRFFDEKLLLTNRPASVRDIIRVEVIDYVELLLRAWFHKWDRQQPNMSWDSFALLLLAQKPVACSDAETHRILHDCNVAERLSVAFDKAASSFVRQFAMLDYALKKSRPEAHRKHGGVFKWLETLIPPLALSGSGPNMPGMPITKRKLEEYKATYL